jgi:hypothetical protein
VGPHFWKALLLGHYAPCKHLTKGCLTVRRSSHSYVGQSLPGPVHSTIFFLFAICVQKRIPKCLSIQSCLAFPYVWCCFLIPYTSCIFVLCSGGLSSRKQAILLPFKMKYWSQKNHSQPLKGTSLLFIYLCIYFACGVFSFLYGFLGSKEKKKPNNMAIYFTLT